MTAIHPSQAAQDRDTSASGFEFCDKPGKLTVLFAGQPIIRFINEHVYFRCFQVMDVRMRPGGPVEFICMRSSSIYPQPNLLACRWETRTIGENIVEVVLTPSKLEGGLDKLASERRTYTIEYLPEKDRFLYHLNVDIVFHADIVGNEGLHHTPMAQWGDDDWAAIEFDDPLLASGVGPQVPMTQDWEGLYEPVLSEEGYTTAWRKRYFDVTMDTVLRGMRRITFNREVNGVQKFYNRTMPVTRPGRPYIYRGLDSNWLKMTPLFEQPASHHICEWGFDMHFYALFAKAGKGLYFKANQHISLSFALEVIQTSEVPRDFLHGVKDAEIEPNERALVDLPIYEEPICRLTESAMDHPDAYAWDPSGHCSWNRTGGHASGLGAMEIAHGESAKESAWTFIHWGPSYACNPVPAFSRYEISAWIKATELDKVALSMEFIGYLGPASVSGQTVQKYTDADRKIVAHHGEWVHVMFPAGPTPTFTLWGKFAFVYTGKGNAAISGVSIMRL